MADSAALPTTPVTPFAAFGFRDFRLLQLGALLSIVGMQMQGVAVGWQLYEVTGKPLDLGYVGLALFLPSLLFSAVTGHAADHLPRRPLLMACHAVLAVASLLLYQLAREQRPALLAVYAVLALIGTARAFLSPAAQALLPNLVPVSVLPNAVAWGSTTWQISVLAGPALGGALYAVSGARGVYLAATMLELLTVAVLLCLQTRAAAAAHSGGAHRELSAGLSFVWTRPVILGAISLDLFAVLFGGAVALLPVFARDILHSGPRALGLLRSAPAVGAFVVAIWLAYRPMLRGAGVIMFGCVAAFGLSTIVFGLSQHFLLSLAALAVSGAADMVSVYIRHNLVQLRTPDAMRGRVAAVNMIFIGASNELGEFESGLVAQWLGPVAAVVVGGLCTCLVVLLWVRWFPALRRVDRVDVVETS